jgi:hypothetical protein
MDFEELKSTGKTIHDLTELVHALLTALPAAKPWQRQMRAQLSDVDSRLQVLRMTIAMEKRDDEIREAADQLLMGLRAANQHGAGGRTDAATRAAVRLALRMGQQISTALASPLAEPGVPPHA